MKFLGIVVVSCLVLLGLALPGYAFNYGGGAQGKDCGAIGQILSLKDELGLTDEQVDKLSKLSYESKKQKIRNEAEVKIAKIELWQLLSKYEINEKEVNKAIDKLYDLKKKAKKELVGNKIKVRAIITKEQFEKLNEFKAYHKGIYKARRKSSMWHQGKNLCPSEGYRGIGR